jgi:hypothetical protein
VIGWDVGLSVPLLVLTGLAWMGAVVTGFFMVAFIDYCPPERCNADNAASAILVAAGVAAVVAVVGIVVSVIRMVRRKVAWPFAVGAVVLSLIVEGLGFVGYYAAAG